MEFQLPSEITELLAARNKLRDRYTSCGLRFTLDGNLVGDIGEAVAAELFDITLSARNGTGIDGHTRDGRSVQVKASGRGRGPAFRMVDTRADHLLFLNFDFEACKGAVTFNGPERTVLALLPPSWVGQRSVSFAQIRRANASVTDGDRIPRRA